MESSLSPLGEPISPKESSSWPSSLKGVGGCTAKRLSAGSKENEEERGVCTTAGLEETPHATGDLPLTEAPLVAL